MGRARSVAVQAPGIAGEAIQDTVGIEPRHLVVHALAIGELSVHTGREIESLETSRSYAMRVPSGESDGAETAC